MLLRFSILTALLWIQRALIRASDVKCSPSNDSTVWIEDPINTIVNVRWGSPQALCRNVSSCRPHSSETDMELPLQLFPVIIQNGVTFRLSPETQWSIIIYNVFKTDLRGFTTCNQSHVVPVVPVSTSGVFEIPPGMLDVGCNYFVLMSDTNTTVSCHNGYRLNVTVRDQNCSRSAMHLKCWGNGICSAKPDEQEFSCACCTGYSGDVCQTCIGDACAGNHICAAAVCQNGGTCASQRVLPTKGTNETLIDNEDIIVIESVPKNSTETASDDEFYCTCPHGYTGQYCETRIHDCSSSPCINGICVERPISFQCYCIPGYHGEHCELEYDECLSSPCTNGAVCIDQIDQYECSCTHGYRGVHCETKIDLCKENACHNASCRDHGDTYSCLCPPGRTGLLCEEDINECDSNPCHNEGTCRDLDGGFECICPVTFAGVHCEYMMDVFAPPLEGSDMNGKTHIHNLYIVAGTLSGAILIVILVLTGCYCKMHETYKQLSWRRMRYKRRSLSCSNLETCPDITSVNKPRLSVDAIWEATSLCYDNASYDAPLPRQLHTHRI